MYKSPIELIESDFKIKIEDDIYKAVQHVGINVDKTELLKALKYDRNQYDKGYQEGYDYAKNEIFKMVDRIKEGMF